jgi:type IV secretion system protein VirB10
MDAPKGLDIHPAPRTSRRISRRVGIAIGGVIIGVLVILAYGGYRREMKNQVQARNGGTPNALTPATAAAREVEKDVPIGNAPLVRNDANQVQPPIETSANGLSSGKLTGTGNCVVDPRSGRTYQFNPATGQACSEYAPDRIVVRQPAYSTPPPAPIVSADPNPEERRITVAYEREQEAMSAPTSIRTGGPNSFAQLPVSSRPSDGSEIAQMAALTQAISGRETNQNAPAVLSRSEAASSTPGISDLEYDAQNNQSAKAAFLSQRQKPSDYLTSARSTPMSPYELKAGWEIPAVLEQSLNSDLPGDVKALVSSNVFDTATGRYLLIPQGARLIGKYDSRISYGQDGVQVTWNRIIFPDASSIDIDGMAGLDDHGNSGLRYDVDHHYKRLLGFTALTSAFSVAFSLSQRTTQSTLTYPSVGSTAASSVGRDLSETGASITRRNLNVQPTIKVPSGYKFTVRVNRDILFDAPYAPVRANPLLIGPPGQLHRVPHFRPR